MIKKAYTASNLIASWIMIKDERVSPHVTDFGSNMKIWRKDFVNILH